MQVEVVPLGAGQDVGRSCVLVTLGGKRIMFDCGIHMGYQDLRRFPDFKYISHSGRLTQALDAVIVTHFHLDHCGALPYLTEVHGYHGPVFMTYPTKALLPLMLEDFRKVVVDRLGEAEHFSSSQIKQCMRRVTAVDLRQTYKVDDELEIRAYYAGHVLGAAMFYAKVGKDVFGPSVLYTGDYNMTPDRHLGAAWVDRCTPDVLITESTYATTIRDSKRSRERDFLQQVHDCVKEGGKVLIPVFALGRAQELAILLEEYWERTGLNVPVYFSAGLTAKANVYYKLLVSWTNQVVKATHERRNVFDFKHVQPFDRAYIDLPGPCVLFASPGMSPKGKSASSGADSLAGVFLTAAFGRELQLHTGMSLEVFKHWCHLERNMVILPGYCVPGTVGNKLISGHRGALQIDQRCTVDVQCKVAHLSFSAHADAKGIMQLIRQAAPRNVLLVHGEATKMEFLKAKIMRTLGVPCFNPQNKERCSIPLSGAAAVRLSSGLIRSALATHRCTRQGDVPMPAETVPVEGILVAPAGGVVESELHASLLETSEAHVALGVQAHLLTLSCALRCPCLPNQQIFKRQRALDDRAEGNPSFTSGSKTKQLEREAVGAVMQTAQEKMNEWFGQGVEVEQSRSMLKARSFQATVTDSGTHEDGTTEVGEGQCGENVIQLNCSWQYEDDPLAHRAIAILQRDVH